MSDTNVATHSNTGTVTRIKGQWLWLGRGLWAILALTTIAAFIYAVPERFETLNTACSSDCVVVQISPEGVENLQEALGLSLTDYAVIVNAKEILLGIIYIVSGLVIFWRRSDDWLVIFISLTIMISGPSVAVFFIGHPVIKALQGIGVALLFNLFLVFPDGRFVPGWTRWIGILVGGFFILSAFTAYFFSPSFFIVLISAMTLGMASQVYRYKRVSTPIQRQQTKWILFGFAVFFVGMIFLILPPLIFPTVLTQPNEPTLTVADFIWRAVIGFFLGFLFLYFLPIAITLSTLRYRLWDADPIINRGLVYGFMTFFAIVLLFVVTYLIQFLFGEQQPLIAVVIAGGFCITTFNPARKRIQHWVDRNLYGLRFDQNELQAAQQSFEIKHPGAMTGKVVDGYEIRGVIGKGGMGEVYRGFGNGQDVAIKTMLPEIARDEVMRTRFQREAAAGKLLQHGNIARVLGSGFIDDTPYLVMEYVDGVELGALLKQDGALDIETSAQIVKHVCDALDLAHQQGYVHRDIKPSNVMIRENGAAVLMDFGVIKSQDTLSALTGTGVIGTIDYMAPEQIKSDKQLDHRADIYALGVMLFEMVTGEKPFTGGLAQIMFAHIQQPPPYAREKDPSIPSELADAIEKAMQKDPAMRFQNVAEFRAALS